MTGITSREMKLKGRDGAGTHQDSRQPEWLDVRIPGAQEPVLPWASVISMVLPFRVMDGITAARLSQPTQVRSTDCC